MDFLTDTDIIQSIKDSNITKGEFTYQMLDGLLDTMLIVSDKHNRAKMYTNVMKTSRYFGIEELAETVANKKASEYGEPEPWELPELFDKKAEKPIEFPLQHLPSVLLNFVADVAKSVQVYPDMIVLPMLSALSECIQGKAVIKFPCNSHTEPLNLYTLTIASPGERKSGVMRFITAPIDKFLKSENKRRRPEIDAYNIEKRLLENELDRIIKGKNADPERAKEIAGEIRNLKPVRSLTMNITDVTPEALAYEMSVNNNRMGILDDEGGIFDILCGLYSGGICNIDLFLKSYDGSPYVVARRTKENIILDNPLLAIGIMTQHQAFEKALQNPQFSGRGLIHRFLFAFPASKAGSRQFYSPAINQTTIDNYERLVFKLLNMKESEELESIQVIRTNKKADEIFKTYFYLLENKIKNDGLFENMREWANKQYARCLRIAGIFHLCEHSADELLDEATAQKAVGISVWAENHACRAFGEVSDAEDETTKNAKYILSKLKKVNEEKIPKSELLRMCRSVNATECDEPLELLEDMKYIKIEVIKNGERGRPKEYIKINPSVKFL